MTAGVQKVWGGVFGAASDALMDAFGASLHFDRRLAPMDALANFAHVRTLEKAGVLTDPALATALAAILAELEDGTLTVDGAFEDVHTWTEAELSKRCGDAAGNLRIARSRNDLVATDLRLWVRQATVRLGLDILAVQKSLISKAAKHVETAIPGYTHLQRAQPVTVAHHLMAYVAMLERDLQRMANVYGEMNATCPLGAGSLGTTTWDIDPSATARLLGFDNPFENSMDAVSDRDYVMSLHQAIALCMLHLSRLSEDLILWTTPEFGFATLPDAFSTGSSLMPQKKNPDVLELIRGRAAITIGNLTGALALLKGLPMTYNRDMQEDKQPLFASVDVLHAALEILAPFLDELEINPHRCAAALSDDTILATDVADHMVRDGDSFAQAHHKTGAAVKVALQQGQPLSTTSGVELTVQGVLAGKSVRGGPGFAPLRASLEQASNRWQAGQHGWQQRHEKDREPYESAKAAARR